MSSPVPNPPTSNPSPASQFPYANFSDFAQAEHPDLFTSPLADPSVHWLRAVLRGVNLPAEFGVSLLGLESGRLVLRWSTCYEEDGNGAKFADGKDLTPDLLDELLQKIDEVVASSEAQVLVLHCLPFRPSIPKPVINGVRIEDAIDTVGARLSLNPRLIVEHFSKRVSRSHEPASQTLPSEKDYVHLDHPGGGYITATSGLADPRGTSIAVVLDSSVIAEHHGARFIPNAKSSYLEVTFNALNMNLTRNSTYHIKPYTTHLLRVALATNKNCHSCTDMNCRATPQTWQELNILTELLLKDFVELQRFLEQEKERTTLSRETEKMLGDFKGVYNVCKAYEKATATQAQVGMSDVAASEANEAYKQARSMEKLTTLAWIFIPLSFSGTFFGMNVAQLNNSGPNIGYFFLLLALSLLISGGMAILYTDWWRNVTYRWRAKIQPFHTCRPRELLFGELLWMTVKWVVVVKMWGSIRNLGRVRGRKGGKGDADNGLEMG